MIFSSAVAEVHSIVFSWIRICHVSQAKELFIIVKMKCIICQNDNTPEKKKKKILVSNLIVTLRSQEKKLDMKLVSL